MSRVEMHHLRPRCIRTDGDRSDRAGWPGRLGGFVAWVIAMAFIAVAAGVEPDEADRGHVLIDTDGTIAELVLHYVPEAREALAPVYRDLLNALPPGVEIRVLCPHQAALEEFLAEWGADAAAGGRTVSLLNVNRALTPWARDRWVAREREQAGGPAPSFVPSPHSEYEPEKRCELGVPRLLARAGAAPTVLRSALHLEGGNIVANRRHVFLGVNVESDNRERDLEGPALDAELLRVLGLQHLKLRDDTDDVPWSHVDMYLTPLDERTVLVGDPAAGQRLLESWTELPDDDEPDTAGGGLRRRMDDSVILQARYDSIARQLRENGYRVVRLPVVADRLGEWLITYNNVLMEQRGTRRVVYMPVYQIAPLDRTAARTYRNMGFEVRTVDVSGLYELGGALRCVANVTRRTATTIALASAGNPYRGTIHVFDFSDLDDEEGANSDDPFGRCMDVGIEGSFSVDRP